MQQLALLTLIFLSLPLQASVSWPVPMSGEKNFLYPIQGAAVPIDETQVEIVSADELVTRGSHCFLERAPDDEGDTLWPQGKLNIESFTITAQIKNPKTQKGSWVLNLALQGGGKAECKMPIKDGEISFSSESERNPARLEEFVAAQSKVHDRARSVLNQFFLINLRLLKL